MAGPLGMLGRGPSEQCDKSSSVRQAGASAHSGVVPASQVRPRRDLASELGEFKLLFRDDVSATAQRGGMSAVSEISKWSN